ncbi:MAG TPA: MauE/DoxX family redox-associated membrane protein [Mycobacterium sp.]|uniref:DoxX family protein n=1 Tax=Mycobacterium sp. TaxID=1785 RepID=UPI002C3AE5C6|nr:MauE/DoxX family redox-associated membrane protein [Mycobacterium sp.]HXO82603.1 MauE/DoxX family redox-associated membrane protein [Mycobacterium sp.]
MLDVDRPTSSPQRSIARLVLGALLLYTGVSHVSFARTAFHAQVPPWLPLNADFVIIASGVVEIALGASLVLLARWRVPVGWVVAAFFVVVFPGNISQFITHANAFELDSDLARGIRLLFQPLLVIWALWCTGAWAAFRNRGSRPPCSNGTNSS